MAFLGSLKASLKTFSRAASINLKTLLNRVSPVKWLRTPINKAIPFTLSSFESDYDIILWPVDTDISRGGSSLCVASRVDSALQIEGALEHHKSQEFYEVLYAEACCTNLIKRRFAPYNGVRVEVKTDGQLYFFSLTTTCMIESMTFFAYIEDKSKDWVTLELPLSAFQNAEEPYSESMHGLDELDEHKLKAVKFGITSPSQTEVEFKAALRRVELVYREDFRYITRGGLPRPVMVKLEVDYSKAESLDTGAIRLK
jgi:hypothetical protein